MSNRSGIGCRAQTAALLSAAAVLGFVTTATSASASANDACPTAYETISVQAAVAEGYRVTPVRMDENGNNDGIVCRLPLGDGILHLFSNATVTQIYEWQDNSTPRVP